jgi:hypothetical protein
MQLTKILGLVALMPICVLHSYAAGGKLLNQPWKRRFLLAAPFAVFVAIALPLLDIDLLLLSAIVATPFLQWLCLLVVYGCFRDVVGRDPRDVFRNADADAADKAVFLIGALLLVSVPAAAFLFAIELAKRLV